MKNVISGFLAIGLGFLVFSERAHAETAPLLLNYQEWSALPAVEQTQYLKELQKVMAGMDEQSEFFAKTRIEAAASRAPASTPVDASEQYSRVSENNLEKAEALLRNAEQIKDSKKKTAEIKKAAALIEKTRYGISLITQDRLASDTYRKWAAVRNNLEKKKTDSVSAELAQIEKIDNIFLTVNRSQNAIVSSEKLLAKERAGTQEYNILSARIANSKTALKVARDELRKNKEAFLAAQEDYKKAAELLPKKDAGEFFRCMYAGFVLKKDCKAPSQLPKDLDLVGITADNYTCDKSLVLCNPLIFGGAASCPVDAKADKKAAAKCLSEMKGFCKPKSSSATRDCLEEAEKSPNNLENTALLIHANPKAWDDYTNSFHSLCDEEKISQNAFSKKKGKHPRSDEEHVKNDIAKTCDWARERLLKLRTEAKIDTKKIDASKLEVGQKKAPTEGRK